MHLFKNEWGTDYFVWVLSTYFTYLLLQQSVQYNTMAEFSYIQRERKCNIQFCQVTETEACMIMWLFFVPAWLQMLRCLLPNKFPWHNKSSGNGGGDWGGSTGAMRCNVTTETTIFSCLYLSEGKWCAKVSDVNVSALFVPTALFFRTLFCL